MSAERSERETFAVTPEVCAAAKKVLFGDLDDPSSEQRLERVSDTLYWNEALKLGRRRKGAEQGTVDFMLAEMQAGRSREESRQILVALKTEIQGERYAGMDLSEDGQELA